jgi:VanZ family protein
MSNSKRGPGRWISVWWPVAVATAVIMCESTVSFGEDHTSGPLRLLWQFLFGSVSNDRWELVHVFLRKTGHFFGYGIAGLTWLRGWRMTLRNSRFLLQAGMALAGTAAVAICDEWHQAYLANRAGSPWDVLLDCLGALVMLMAARIFLRVVWQSKLEMKAEEVSSV